MIFLFASFPVRWDNRNGWLGVKHQITYLPEMGSRCGSGEGVQQAKNDIFINSAIGFMINAN